MVSCVGDPDSIPVKHPSVIKSSNSYYIPGCCLLLYTHCSHKLNGIRRLKSILSRVVKETLYKSPVLPLMEYGAVLFDNVA